MAATSVFSRAGAWAWALPPKPREATRYVGNATPLSLGVWLVVAAGTALRWHGIDAESLWLDEIASHEFAVARYDSSLELATTAPVSDPHPPLYYLLLRWWGELFGTSAFALRGVSALLGALAILLTYLLAVKLFERRTTGLAASALVAVSSMHVYFAQEARMYTLLAALTLASFYWYVDVVFADEPGRSSVARYVVATVLLGYTHTYGVFVVFAQSVFVLVLARRELAAVHGGDGGDGDAASDGSRLAWVPRLPGVAVFRRVAAAQAVVAVLLAPWLVVLAGHALGLSFVDQGDTGWIPGRSLGYLFATIDKYLFYNVGDLSVPGHGLLVWVAIGLAVAALLRFNPDADPDDDVDELEVEAADRSLMLAVWLVVPVLTPYLVSVLLQPIYVHKYTIGASLAFFIMVAHGLRKLGDDYGDWFAVGLAVVLVVGVAAPLTTIYDEQQHNDWRGATEPGNFEQEPFVVTAPPYMDNVVEYHTRDVNATVRSVPNDATWEGELADVVGDRETVYVVASNWYTGGSRGLFSLVGRFEAGGYGLDRDDVERYPWGVFVFELGLGEESIEWADDDDDVDDDDVDDDDDDVNEVSD